MGKSKASEAMINTIGSMLGSPVYGQKLLGGVGVDSRRLTQVAPIDDNLPPAAPVNFTLTPYLGSLIIDFTPPPLEDQVAYTTIEYTPQGGTLKVITSTSDQPFIENLAAIPHSVRIQFVDRWGRTSPWTTKLTATPAEHADYAINLEKARQTGNLTNLITAINASAIDPNNLSETMIKNIALAQGQGSNLLSLIETSFDRWSNAEDWPPLDSDVNGIRYITAIMPAGNTARVLDRAGVKWLEYTRASAAVAPAGYIEPFAEGRKGTFIGEEYIASVYVDGTANHRVRLGIIGVDPNGVSPQRFLGRSEEIVLDNKSGGQRIHIKFTIPSDNYQIKFRFENVNNGSITYWNRLQLERADGKTEPTSWNAGIFTTGVIGANLISAIDLNAANALFKSAVIETGKIRDLTAQKIWAGSVTAGQIALAGGSLKAGQIYVDKTGVEMPRSLIAAYDDLTNKEYSISTSDMRQTIVFYNNQSNFFGTIIRSAGNGSNRQGAILLQSVYNLGADPLLGVSASLEILGGPDWTPAGLGMVRVNRGEFYNKLRSGISVGVDAEVTLTHSLQHNPTIITAYVSQNPGTNTLWRPLPSGIAPTAGGIDVYVRDVTSSSLAIFNTSAVAQTVYATCT